MSTKTPSTDLQVGDAVVEMSIGYKPGPYSGKRPEETTVERFTKTQVILANGSRYRLNQPGSVTRSGGGLFERSTGSGFHVSSFAIYRPDEPRVVEALRADRAYRVRANTEARVVDLMAAMRRADDLSDAAARAREAAAALVAAADRLDVLAAPTPSASFTEMTQGPAAPLD